MQRSKIKLLFVRRSGVADEMLEEKLGAEAGRLSQRVDGKLGFCYGFAEGDTDLHRVAAGEFNAAEHPFDAMMEIVAEEGATDAVIPLLEGLSDRLGDVIDPALSSALVGREHVILPGAEPLLVLIMNRRLPDFTHAKFLDYWLAFHGPFARENTPPEVGMGYRQFHTDDEATTALTRATGFKISDFDGAAECHYRNADAVRLLMGKTEVVDQATEDELKFVDHGRCVTSVLRITPASTSHQFA